MLKVGDNIAVEHTTGYTTIGRFVSESDEYVVVEGTVGDKIGQAILVPKSKVERITVFDKR